MVPLSQSGGRDSARPLDQRTDTWTEDRNPLVVGRLQRTERELRLEHARRPIAQPIPQVTAGPEEIAQQLHLGARTGQLLTEFEEGNERGFGIERSLEARAQRQDIAAGDRKGARAGAQAPHFPPVERELGPAERQARRAVRQDPIPDGALRPALDPVVAGRRVDEGAAEILPSSERPFDAEARANLAARRQRLAIAERRVARAVAVARSRANRPVGAHLERGCKARRHTPARSEIRRHESEEVGRGRTEQRNGGIGDGGGPRRNRADEIEHETPRNHANRRAEVGVDQPGVIDRFASDVRRCARECRPDIDRQAIAEPLSNADRNGEFADPPEPEAAADAVRFEKRTGSRSGPGLRGGSARREDADHRDQQVFPTAGHGSLKMIRITPKVWTTFVTPWLS